MAIPNDKGGYEYHFVDPPSDTLVCKICQYPSREPHLSGCCGHTFCKSCLEGAKKVTTIADACPICRNKQFVTMPNKQANRTIRSLHVFCANKKKGCEWQGEVNNIVDHLTKSTGCQLEEVICSNNCGQTLQRQLLTSHVEAKCPRRKVDCQYCHITGECQFVKGEHKEQCPKFPTACPNKCEVGSVPRDDVEEHMKMCPLELIQCRYHMVGCEERMPRKDQKKHNKEKIEQHLSFTIGQLPSTHKDLASILVEAMKDLNSKISQTNDELTVNKQQLTKDLSRVINTQKETKIIVFQKIKQELNAAWFYGLCALSILVILLAFFIHSLSAVNAETLAKLDTAFQKKIAELETTFQKKIAKLETKLDTTFQKKIAELETTFQKKIAKLETKLDTTFQKKIAELETTFQKKIAELETKLDTTFQKKIAELETTFQKKIAKLETKLEQKAQQIINRITWNAEIISNASKLSSGDQVVPVIVKMSEYTKKKRDEVDWFSDPFYTHHKGYKIQLNVVAAGYGSTKGTYLSVFVFHKGNLHNDQSLKGHCEIKLLNQISNSEHYVKTSNVNTTRRLLWHNKQFIAHKDLHNITSTCQYIKDDSIFFKVSIKLE
ncbi:TNF receptor-associated factor 5-like [Dysidea avara]|uniref:TNF receptor-associated factor 5-like n=1 Tax=Dysidea avara TaxID=196820 RepID=UPI003319E7BF